MCPPEGNDGALPEGTPVEANYRGLGRWFDGKVARVKRKDAGDWCAPAVTYDVLFDDGDFQRGVPKAHVRAKGAAGHRARHRGGGGVSDLRAGLA